MFWKGLILSQSVSKCHKVSQTVSKCLKMSEDVLRLCLVNLRLRYFIMCQNTSFFMNLNLLKLIYLLPEAISSILVLGSTQTSDVNWAAEQSFIAPWHFMAWAICANLKRRVKIRLQCVPSLDTKDQWYLPKVFLFCFYEQVLIFNCI